MGAQAVRVEKRVGPFGVSEGAHHRNQGARVSGVDVDPAAIGALVEAGDDRMGLGVVRAFGQDDDLRTHRAEHGVVERQVDALASAGGFAVQQSGDDGGRGGERAEDAGVRDRDKAGRACAALGVDAGCGGDYGLVGRQVGVGVVGGECGQADGNQAWACRLKVRYGDALRERLGVGDQNVG